MDTISNELDYSPLKGGFVIAEKSSLTDIPRFNNKIGTFLISVILLLMLKPRGTQIIFVTIFVFVAVWLVLSRSGDSATRLSNFAVKNGFMYRWGQQQKVALKGILSSNTKYSKASNIIAGTYKDIDFRLFSPYLKGSYTIMRINLKNNYPHIVLDNLNNNSLISGSITKFFDNDSHISLEGDFDNHFKMYSKTKPIDSLRIMSPDMMALVMDFSHSYDIELIENNLNIIGNFKLSNAAGMKEFFTLADTLMDKLDRRTATRTAEFDSATHIS